MKRSILFLATILLVSTATGFSWGPGKAAVIELSGPISNSDTQSVLSGGQGINPDEVRSLTDRALKDGADAIVYEINSGGGAVVASKETKAVIESAPVPTVCRYKDVAASGGYLISLGCDRIVSDSVSITGSIGVKSSFLEYSGLLNKLGIEYVNITAGRYKGVGSPYQNVSESDSQMLKRKAQIVHEEFVNIVQEERNLTENQSSRVGQGQIFLGKEAEELGLVDHLGGREKALNVAENMTGRELNYVQVRDTPSFSILSLLGIDSVFSGMDVRTPITASFP